MNPYFISYLPIAVMSIGYFVYVYKQQESLHNRYFFLISLIYFVTCGASGWLNPSIGQDNNQWFFIGKNIFEHFGEWHHHFAVYDHTRILSALPAGFLWWIGIQTPHIIFMILVVVSAIFILWFGIESLNGIVKSKDIQIGISLFLIAYSSFGEIHFWTFSSEHMVITIFITSLLLIRRCLKDDSKPLVYILSGLLLTASTFAKEQFSMSAIAVYLTFSIYLIQKKQFKNWGALTSGCLTTATAIWALCLQPFSWESLTAYYSIGFEYQNRSFADQQPIQMNAFFFKQFIDLIFINPHYFLFTLAFLFFISFSLKEMYLRRKKDKSFVWSVLISVYFITALFSILMAKKNIAHYAILLIPGFFFFFTIFISRLLQFKNYFPVIIAIYLIFAPFVIRKSQAIFPVFGYQSLSQKLQNDTTFSLIKKHIPSGKRVLLWGYANHYMVNINAQRSSAYLFSQFAFPPLKASAFVREQYLKDLIKFKPEYILELVGPHQFFTTDTSKHSIKVAHPSLMNEIMRTYDVILDSAEVRIYRYK